MRIIETLLICCIAIAHIYFLILEMFLWTQPKGIKTFGLKTKEFAQKTKVLGANQGLYNGFLAAGFIWSLFEPSSVSSIAIQTFFLSCIIIAGIYGAYSIKKDKTLLYTICSCYYCYNFNSYILKTKYLK